MKKIIIILSIVLFCVSCSDDEKEQETTYVTITPETIDTDYRESKEIIKVKSNTDWKITNIPEWCAFEKVEGRNDAEINLTIKENELSTERRVSININDKVLKVSQKGSILDEGVEIMTNKPNFDENFEVVRYIISNNIEKPFAKYRLDEKNISLDWSFKRSNLVQKSYAIEKINPLYEKGCTSGCIPSIVLKFVYNYTDSNFGLSFVKNNIGNPKQLLVNNSPYAATNNFNVDNFNVVIQNGECIYTFKNYKTWVNDKEYYTVNGKMKFSLK